MHPNSVGDRICQKSWRRQKVQKVECLTIYSIRKNRGCTQLPHALRISIIWPFLELRFIVYWHIISCVGNIGATLIEAWRDPFAIFLSVSPPSTSACQGLDSNSRDQKHDLSYFKPVSVTKLSSGLLSLVVLSMSLISCNSAAAVQHPFRYPTISTIYDLASLPTAR